MGKKQGFLIVIAILLPAISGCNEQQVKVASAVDQVVTVRIDTNAVLEKDFLGIGAQWSAYPEFDVSEEDWQKVFSRVDYLKMPFTRVMISMGYCFRGLDDNGKPKYDFNSQRMLKNYKLLDYCQKNNVKVMFGQWGLTRGIDRESPMQAKITADLIGHLVNAKGYTCIRWYNYINEPNGEWSSCRADWNIWRKVTSLLHAELKQRGLLEKIQLCGPDDSNLRKDWILGKDRALDDAEVRSWLGIYEPHWYMYWDEKTKTLAEDYEQKTRQLVEAIAKNDPGKQLYLGEAGLNLQGQGGDCQMHVYDYWYGVTMADAAIQKIRGGMSGFIAWYLDDSMHTFGPRANDPKKRYAQRKIWGLWSILGPKFSLPEDQHLRPWFYTWSALSRNFPPGCQTLKVPQTGVDQLRVAAAKIPDGKRYDLSFAAVNNSDTDRTVQILIPGLQERISLGRYEYTDADGNNKPDAWSRVIDDNGNDIFPKPSRVMRNIRPSRGINLYIPAKSVIILSTLEGGYPVSLKK